MSSTGSDPTANLSAVAARLRAHPDVTSGPSVRAVLAVGELYDAVGVVACGSPPAHVARLLRAALLALPHRLRVRPGADAEQIVRDAVFAVVLPPGEAESGSPESAADEVPRGRRPVFRMAEAADAGAGSNSRTALPGAEPEIGALLVDVLRPARRGPLADGLTHSSARPPVGERGAPVRMRLGDPSRYLSVRATLRAALRGPAALAAASPTSDVPAAPAFIVASDRAGAVELASSDVPWFSVDSLRVRRPRPDVTLDVVLALDVSASMAGAEVASLARAVAGAAVRAGHRVALQAFATSVSPLCGLTRDPNRLLAAAAPYEPANPTNLENAICAAHDLLVRTGSRSRAGVILLVTDAEPTACGTPQRRARGYGATLARLAALDAAVAARAAGVAVSVLCPSPGTVARVDLEFAARLAAAGGGTARTYPSPAAADAMQWLIGS